MKRFFHIYGNADASLKMQLSTKVTKKHEYIHLLIQFLLVNNLVDN